MPVTTQAPVGIGSIDGWGLGAGASKVAAVATKDGDTTYIFTATNGANQRFTFNNVPSEAISPFVSVTSLATFRLVTGGPTGHIFNGNTNISIGPMQSAYTDHQVNWQGTARSQVDGIEGGVALTGAGTEGNCTYLDRVITYNVGFTAFAHLVGGFLGAAWGLRDIVGAVSLFNRLEQRRRDIIIRIDYEEIPDVVRGMLEWKRPAFAFFR